MDKQTHCVGWRGGLGREEVANGRTLQRISVLTPSNPPSRNKAGWGAEERRRIWPEMWQRTGFFLRKRSTGARGWRIPTPLWSFFSHIRSPEAGSGLYGDRKTKSPTLLAKQIRKCFQNRKGNWEVLSRGEILKSSCTRQIITHNCIKKHKWTFLVDQINIHSELCRMISEGLIFVDTVNLTLSRIKKLKLSYPTLMMTQHFSVKLFLF